MPGYCRSLGDRAAANGATDMQMALIDRGINGSSKKFHSNVGQDANWLDDLLNGGM